MLDTATPHKPLPRWLSPALLGLAVIGLADATYLTIEHYMNQSPFCSIVTGCDRVLRSQYATVAYNIPTALLGIMYYGALIALIATYLRTKDVRALRLASTGTIVGFIASLWFVYLQLFVIRAICPYCMVSAAASTALFTLAAATLIRFNRKKGTPSSG